MSLMGSVRILIPHTSPVCTLCVTHNHAERAKMPPNPSQIHAVPTRVMYDARSVHGARNPKNVGLSHSMIGSTHQIVRRITFRRRLYPSLMSSLCSKVASLT